MANLFQEFQKFIKNKNVAEEGSANANYFAEFACIISSLDISLHKKWILDSSTSSHITGNFSLLHRVKLLSGINNVALPDGTIKIVKYVM